MVKNSNPVVYRVNENLPIIKEDRLMSVDPSMSGALKRSFKGFWVKVAIPFGIISGAVALRYLLGFFSPQLQPVYRNLIWLFAVAFVIVGYALIITFTALRRFLRSSSSQIEKLTEENTNLRKAKELVENDDANNNPLTAFKINSRLFGLYKNYHNVTYSLGEQSDMLVNNETKITATLHEIPGIEHVVSSGKLPEDKPESIGVKLVDYESEHDIKIHLDFLTEQKNLVRYKLRFTPQLYLDQSIKYRLEEALPPGAFAMNLEELKEKEMEWEFISNTVSYPTEELFLRVVLPRNFNPTDYAYDTWATVKSQQRHPTEYARIHEAKCFRDGWDAGTLFMSLTIAHPIQGLTYVIKWKPPKEKTVSQ